MITLGHLLIGLVVRQRVQDQLLPLENLVMLETARDELQNKFSLTSNSFPNCLMISYRRKLSVVIKIIAMELKHGNFDLCSIISKLMNGSKKSMSLSI